VYHPAFDVGSSKFNLYKNIDPGSKTGDKKSFSYNPAIILQSCFNLLNKTKMLKKIFIWFWVIILVLVNFPYLLSFYNNWKWREYFEQKKYDLAKEKFSQTADFEWIYNLWNTYYKQWKYEDSIKTYLSILWTWKNDLNFKLNYNLWNAYYRYGESQENLSLKRWYWLKAVDYYKQALKIKYDQQAKDNLEFVLNKLKDLGKNNKQQQNKQEQKKQNKKQNWQKKDGQKKEWQKKNSKNWKKQNNSSSKNWKKQWEKKQNQTNWKNGNKSKTGKKKQAQTAWNKQNKPQTEQEKKQAQMMKALQEYQKNLKQQQRQNMQNYGKVYQPPRNNDPFDDPFFTWMPRQWDNVKDW